MKGTRSVFAERAGTGYFLDFDWKRQELARCGLSVEEAQAAVATSIGGENVTTTSEGRERYPVNVRYLRDFRSDQGALDRVLVAASSGQKQIPVAQLANIHASTGPSMIRDKDGLLTAYVYVDIEGRDPQGYVQEADALLRGRLDFGPVMQSPGAGNLKACRGSKNG